VCNLKGVIALILVFLPSSVWGMGDDPLSGDTTARFLLLSDQAADPSLVYNNEGITPNEGGNLYLSLLFRTQLYPWEIVLEPLIIANEKAAIQLHEGYLHYKGSSLHTEIGKRSLWWGPGVHGSLLLSNNAEPLHLIRIYHPDSFLLPGFLSAIGPLQFDLFISQLEEDRVVPKPYLQGTRIVLKPHSMLEVGLTRTIMMGGEGRPSVTPSRFLDIWFGENKEGAAVDLSNSLAGIDLNLIFSGARFYGEFAGEDEAGYFPSKEAYLVGVYSPRGLFQNDFRIEYADITDPSWYVHSLYQSGYTYKKRILGHHVGRGGRDLYLEHGVADQKGKRGKITFDYEERGVNIQPVIERHYQVGTAWEFTIDKMMIPWTIETNFIYEWVQNAANQTGFDQTNALVAFAFVGKI